MLNKQELIDAKVLVPILRKELEELESREQGGRVMLLDGFPRNLAQRRGFEEVVSMLARKLAAVLYIPAYVLTASSSQNPYSFCSSTVLKRSQSSGISRATWKGGRRMTRQCSRNDIRNICKRMRISFVNIGRGSSWWRSILVRGRRSRGRGSITD